MHNDNASTQSTDLGFISVEE